MGDPYLVTKYTNTKISSPAVSWEPGDWFPPPLRDLPGRSQWQGGSSALSPDKELIQRLGEVEGGRGAHLVSELR